MIYELVKESDPILSKETIKFDFEKDIEQWRQKNAKTI